MIEFVFSVNNKGEFTSAKVTGHSGQAEFAHDVLCAAASTITLSTINALEEYVKVDINPTVKEGFTVFKLGTLEGNKKVQAQTLMNAMYLCAKNLAEENKKYIKTSKMEEI